MVTVEICRLHLVQLISVPVLGEVHLTCDFAGLEAFLEGSYGLVLLRCVPHMFGEGRHLLQEHGDEGVAGNSSLSFIASMASLVTQGSLCALTLNFLIGQTLLINLKFFLP